MPDEVVKIEWGIIPNGNERAGGFLPVYYVDGRQRGHTFGARGYDADEALLRAEAMAREEADRYIGDWKVTVKHRKNTPFGGTMGSADRQTIHEFLRKYPVEIKATRTDHNPYMAAGSREMDHWRVRLKGPEGLAQLYFSMGFGHGGKPPTVADVINSMASDATSAENARDWEDFAREMGMRLDEPADRRKAKKTYDACWREKEQLDELFGSEAAEELKYQTEGL